MWDLAVERARLRQHGPIWCRSKAPAEDSTDGGLTDCQSTGAQAAVMAPVRIEDFHSSSVHRPVWNLYPRNSTDFSRMGTPVIHIVLQMDLPLVCFIIKDTMRSTLDFWAF
ncbi:hypothetical protein IRJ41_006952 [Triplophysa rosa]|uniref:Uncharacterized protein n=1 Tax=Triplophysa rosa TaxID=992332 RepID=A0A9W7TTW7_TRIRA|nr:hypothetical protein IRJ41_006952 [Triplophysa rosa]